MEQVLKRFNEHSLRDEQQFRELAARLDCMENNHLAHIEKSTAALEIGVSEIKSFLGKLHDKLDTNTEQTVKNSTNIGWLMWGFMAFGGAVIVNLVATLFKK